MLLYVVAFLGGVLTIVSPCILPVVPFVFSGAGKSFNRSGLPMLAGMAISFAGVAAAATYGGSWVVRVNQYGRDAALALLAVFALTLLVPRFAELTSRPFVRLGNALSGKSSRESNVLQSVVLGVATGLLWAPCAGPILGLILTGAALGGAGVRTAGLLLAYALGAAVSLGLVLIAGNRLVARLKRSLGIEELLRRALGVLVLVGVTAIALGWDRGILTKLSAGNSAQLEQGVIDRLQPRSRTPAAAIAAGGTLSDEGPFPGFGGATQWLNSPPLTASRLRGKALLIDFWTYSCINCLRSLPYVRAWWKTYAPEGLIVVGVHTPEFAFEKDGGNVRKAVADLGVTYPVALDNDYRIWNAFHNEYWPAHYLVDAGGRIRYHHFGEGDYGETENAIREVLSEHRSLGANSAAPAVTRGVERQADNADMLSPETYLGSARTENFAGTSIPVRLALNHWALSGPWQFSGENITLVRAPGKIAYRFHARDVHLVLGLGADRIPIRLRVTIDGAAPGRDAGADVNSQGSGTVREHRLYQLIRQAGAVRDRTIVIEFLGAGVAAYAFTFG